MKVAEFFFILFILLIVSCRLHDYPQTLVEESQHSKKEVSRFEVIDLNDDGEDEILTVKEKDNEFSEIILQDGNFETFSQLNYLANINRLSFFDVNGDREKEIFVSGVTPNGEIFLNQVHYEWKKTLHRSEKPLLLKNRQDKLPIGKRCYSNFGVEGMLDIDDDGTQEIIIRGAAGFACYPRGLWLIDAKTGEEKWHYEIAGNILCVNNADLDQDGETEFILSTEANKNQGNIINQTDDHHSYLIILNKYGETLFREELSRGYSKIYSFLEDIDVDGNDEIIAVKTTWGKQQERNGIYIYKWVNNRLSLLREKQFEIPFSRNGGVYCEDLDNDGKSEVFVITAENELLVFNNDLEVVGRFDKIAIRNLIGIVDLDCDGNKEIVCVSIEGNLMVLDKNLQCIMKYDERDISEASVKIFDPGFGNSKQILVYQESNFIFYDYKPVGFSQVFYLKLFIVFLAFIFVIFILRHYFRTKHSIKISTIILDNLQAGVMVVNKSGRIFFSNEQIIGILGTKLRRNRKLIDVCLPVSNEYEKYCASEKTEQKIKLDYLQNNRNLEIHFKSLKDKSGCVMIAISDQTDILQLQEKADWAETARGLSHGIRKHLNNIQLATEQIATNKDSKIQRLSPVIKEEINNLKYFVQSFQRFTELKKLSLQLLDANELIKQYLEAKLTEFPDRIRFTSEIEHDLPWLKIDKIRFAEVLDNLLNNALEAIEEEGKIILKAYRWEENSNVVKFCLEISDTGCGISPDIIKNIFVPYFTTKASGTGIGLPLVKKMMNEFEGRVEAESKSEVGTTIRLVFPAYSKGEV
ncbi:MAG: ATP-binding protein [Candidatus Stygibacter australis]|nr:ATP-binding protein [Candidatus Stygibacter australis]